MPDPKLRIFTSPGHPQVPAVRPDQWDEPNGLPTLPPPPSRPACPAASCSHPPVPSPNPTAAPSLPSNLIAQRPRCANCCVGLKEKSSCLVVAGNPLNKCTSCIRATVVCHNGETTNERRARLRMLHCNSSVSYFSKNNLVFDSGHVPQHKILGINMIEQMTVFFSLMTSLSKTYASNH